MVVKCPTCQRPVNWSDASPHRPFCSRRCQLIDFGEWASEGHGIADTPATDDGTARDDAGFDSNRTRQQNR